MSIVQLCDVQMQYRDVKALKGLDLELEQGEVLGLFGHNGAGKTTTIKLILGLIKATAGEVRVFGRDPSSSESRDLRKHQGFLQENVSFYQQLTGLEVLLFFARLKGIGQAPCIDLLAQVGLDHAAKRRVKTYSKGMRQRLGLAQALLGDPKLLLLDEPTVGLDPIATLDFYQRIDQLKQRGCTVILCSHALPGVENYIDRAMILGNGQLLAQGSIAALRQQADLPLTLHLQGDNIHLPPALAERAVKSARGFQIPIPLSEKMASLKQVTALPGVQNLDIHLPSLDDLYAHFTAPLSLGEVRS